MNASIPVHLCQTITKQGFGSECLQEQGPQRVLSRRLLDSGEEHHHPDYRGTCRGQSHD